MQISLNLAYGSAMARSGSPSRPSRSPRSGSTARSSSASDHTDIVLLFTVRRRRCLTVVPGRAKPLLGGIHLAILAAFVFLTISP